MADLYLLWSSIDELRGRVEVGVLVGDPAVDAELDASYGLDVVDCSRR